MKTKKIKLSKIKVPKCFEVRAPTSPDQVPHKQ